jgi:hypothetical protein
MVNPQFRPQGNRIAAFARRIPLLFDMLPTTIKIGSIF